MLIGITLLRGVYKLMDLEKWKNKNNRAKGYTHFDERVNIHNVWNYITDSKKIASHGYYPLIHTNIVFNKYNKDVGIKSKKREVAYSAHIDRLILSYYALQLNDLYNQHVKSIGINENAIAYRNILGKSNIEFSKDAFDFIKDCDQAIIVVGDFTDFFGSLDHNYLKAKLLDLLREDKLSPDWYGIFKYVTKYVYWELESLLELNGYDKNFKSIRNFNQQKKALKINDFKSLKKNNLKKNNKEKGIPQGTPISALLSNVYMMDFDVQLSEYIKQYKGFYNRYSDDFILILPNIDDSKFKTIYKAITDIIERVPNIDLQLEKTQMYEYNNQCIKNINSIIFNSDKKDKDILDYLGFTFDGQKVRFRDKTLTKYYYKMYRKTKGILNRNGYTKKNNRISNTELYKRYSIRGVQGKFKHSDSNPARVRNFLSYILRAEKVYYSEEEILKFRKRHMGKIRKRLKKIEA